MIGGLIVRYKFYLIIAALSAVFLWAFTYNGNRLKLKIAELEGMNKILERANDTLIKQRKVLFDSISMMEFTIKELYSVDDSLFRADSVKKNELLIFNKRYEKAAHHSNNYTIDSIRRYFSNIK